VITIYVIGLLSGISLAQPLAEGQNKFLGCCIGNTIYSNFDDYWNQATPEDAGKWGSVAANQDTNFWNWSPLNQVYDYAKNKNIPFRFHVLI
jgi:endo-1,4-beta-xylanase